MVNNIKKVLFFWQEIILITAICFYLHDIREFITPSVLIITLITLFILVFQIFKKNLIVSCILSAILGYLSLYMILACLSDVFTGNYATLWGRIFGIILFLGLSITAFSMPIKYALIKAKKVEKII